MPARTLALGVVLLAVVLSGCAATGGGPLSQGTTPTTQGTETVCDSPPEPPTRELPEKPSNLTRSNVTSYAAAYEEAVAWNAKVADGMWDLIVGVDNATVVNETGDGYVVHLDGGHAHSTCLDEGLAHGMGGIETNYFVNDTATVELASDT